MDELRSKGWKPIHRVYCGDIKAPWELSSYDGSSPYTVGQKPRRARRHVSLRRGVKE